MTPNGYCGENMLTKEGILWWHRNQWRPRGGVLYDALYQRHPEHAI